MDTPFGGLLRHYRKARDLTQAELAELVICAEVSIRKIEAGRQRPSKLMAERLAASLKLEPAERSEFLRLARGSTNPAPAPIVLAQAPPGNLPAHAPLIGRDAEIASLLRLLGGATLRLLTLTGPGGVGKTQLALAVITSVRANPAALAVDEVVFVTLAGIKAASQVPSALIQALQVREIGGTALLESLRQQLSARRMLLVIDNFEHLLSAAPLLTELLAAASGLKLLVTSRSMLHLYGEHEYVVAPLPQPINPDQPLDSPAVQLFLARAQVAQPDLQVTAETLAAITTICQRVDGLPLALELAAAQCKLYSPAQIAARLQDRLAFLVNGPQDVAMRHQTLRNTIDWSYALLQPAEQHMFRVLSVFASGWSLEAAHALIGGEPAAVDPAIAALLNHSLIQRLAASSDEPRFAMLETIRAYALEQLNQPERLRLQQAHAAYYLQLAEAAGHQLFGPQAARWLHQLQNDIDNLHTALQWFYEQRGWQELLRMAQSLHYFWYIHGQPSDLLQWIDRALSAAQLPAAIEAGLRHAQGAIYYAMYNAYDQARQAFEQALVQWQALPDNSAEQATTLCWLGLTAMEQADYAAAQAWLTACVALRERLAVPGDIIDAQSCLAYAWLRQGALEQAQALLEACAGKLAMQPSRSLAFVLTNLGDVAEYQGRLEQAQSLHRQAIAMWEQIDDVRGVAFGLNQAAATLLACGLAAEAYSALRRSMHLRWGFKDRDGLAWNFERLASVAAVSSAPALAGRLWGAAQALRRELGAPLPPLEAARYAALWSSMRAPDWADAIATGSALSLDQAVALALGATVNGPPPV